MTEFREDRDKGRRESVVGRIVIAISPLLHRGVPEHEGRRATRSTRSIVATVVTQRYRDQ